MHRIYTEQPEHCLGAPERRRVAGTLRMDVEGKEDAMRARTSSQAKSLSSTFFLTRPRRFRSHHHHHPQLMANNAPDVAICASDASASTLNGLSNDVEQLTVSSSSAVESRASPPSEVRALLQALQAHSTSLQSKPLLRSSTFDVSSSASGGVTYTLHSWKVLEHAYRKVTSVGVGPLDDMPTLARGLFTVDEEGQEPRIVVRGYDKFFNVGELPWTKVSAPSFARIPPPPLTLSYLQPKALAEHTTGPFTVTWKENGCIIFLSALDQETLIVCSKHSTGQREEGVLSHAQVGEAWLDRHLEKRGRTRVELARELWRRGETAVAEVSELRASSLQQSRC